MNQSFLKKLGSMFILFSLLFCFTVSITMPIVFANGDDPPADDPPVDNSSPHSINPEEEEKNSKKESKNIYKLPPIMLLEKLPGQGSGKELIIEGPTDSKKGGYTIRIIEAYLKYVYPYAVAVIASLALFMTVLGSFEITTAGGDSAKVGAGKDRIMYAIGGLVLLLVASLILFTINPTFFSYGA